MDCPELAAVFTAPGTDTRVVLVHYRPGELTADRIAAADALVPCADLEPPADVPAGWRPVLHLIDGVPTHKLVRDEPDPPELLIS